MVTHPHDIDSQECYAVTHELLADLTSMLAAVLTVVRQGAALCEASRGIDCSITESGTRSTQ